MRRMILRAACAALVLSVAACSSSGGPAPAPSSPAPAVEVLPRAVSCGHLLRASDAARDAWAAELVAGLEATGQVPPIAPSAVRAFAVNVASLCGDSLASSDASAVASSLAVQSWGH